MPKIKTHRGAKKRFKKTGTGKIKAYHAFHSHLLGKKTSRRKRRLRSSIIIDSTDVKRIRELLPY